jgi:hypothetical protein
VTLRQEVRLSDEERQQTFSVSGTANDEFIETLITYDAFQQTEITAVIADIVYEEQEQTAQVNLNPQGTPQPPAQPQPSQITVQSLMLALDPQDALVLKHLKDLGAIFDFVLRSPTSTEFFELAPVTSDYLLDKYELEILR